MKITKRQLLQIIREEKAKNTKKYNDDSALKGDQDKLPDALQKGIIDKTVDDREKNESRESYLLKVVQEAQDILEAPDLESVETTEDAWAGGQDNISMPVDHATAVHGAEENVKSPETLTISELRKIIKTVILEAKKKN